MLQEEQNLVEVQGNKKIIIHFDKIFNRDLSHCNEFELDKRSYYNCINLIADDIRGAIYNSNSNYAYNLLSLKYNSTRTGYDFEKFMKDVFTIVKDDNLLDYINIKVESEYTIDISNEDKNENKLLQITNELNKTYLKAIIMMRLLVPTTTVLRNFDERSIDDLIFEMFSDVLIYFNNGDNSILEKIHNIVSSRVKTTRYSDIVIWKLLLHMNMDPIIVIKKYYRYIIVNTLLKIENNRSVISYTHAVLKNKLEFMFTFNYKMTFKVLDYENLNDSLSELEKVEINLVRNDKGILRLNDLSIKQELTRIRNTYDEKEIEEFINKIELTPLAISFIEIYYEKLFILSSDQEQLKLLLFNMIKVLEENNFKLIPEVLQSEISSIKINNKKKIMEKISESKKYQYFLDKYSVIEDLIEKNNFLLAIVFSIKGKKFINPETKEELVINIEKISEEVIDFLIMT